MLARVPSPPPPAMPPCRRFPDDYPTQPFLLRVVSPRMAPYSGGLGCCPVPCTEFDSTAQHSPCLQSLKFKFVLLPLHIPPSPACLSSASRLQATSPRAARSALKPSHRAAAPEPGVQTCEPAGNWWHGRQGTWLRGLRGSLQGFCAHLTPASGPPAPACPPALQLCGVCASDGAGEHAEC
jgi:hypothetical protein